MWLQVETWSWPHSLLSHLLHHATEDEKKKTTDSVCGRKYFNYSSILSKYHSTIPLSLKTTTKARKCTRASANFGGNRTSAIELRWARTLSAIVQSWSTRGAWRRCGENFHSMDERIEYASDEVWGFDQTTVRVFIIWLLQNHLSSPHSRFLLVCLKLVPWNLTTTIPAPHGLNGPQLTCIRDIPISSNRISYWWMLTSMQASGAQSVLALCWTSFRCLSTEVNT